MATSLLLSLPVSAQKSDKIAGQYQFQAGLLVIKPDSTFLILGYGTVVIGVVEMEDSEIKLIPHKPKYPFILYGRTKLSIAQGNTVKFNNFDQVETLINYEKDNNSLGKMMQLFNVGANCWPSKIVLDNPNTNKKFYFAIKGKKEVYTFENNQGYNDFIAVYLPQGHGGGIENSEINFNLSEKGNGLIYRGNTVKKLTDDAISEKEIEKLIGMSDRSSPEFDKYYCNPDYNYFEENGIDLSNYTIKKNGKEYYFLNKNNVGENDDDYNNTSVIYEYKKINTAVLADTSYSIDTKTVFTFTCD